MLELRPSCECCRVDLPPAAQARICTVECTSRPRCAAGFGRCPNCGGDLTPRPVRPAGRLAAAPASTVRVERAQPCPH